MKGNNLKEKYLLFKAKTKDPDAFSKVYDLYTDRIYRFIYFKVSGKEEAQDLTAEVFLKTWQYIIDGKEIKNLNALFYKIARNLVIDHYRKESRKEISLEREIMEQQEIKMIFDSKSKVEQQIQYKQIEDQLRNLKDEYREVVILRFIEELSIKEIAEVLGKKSGAVRVILYRAINALKELMEESGGKEAGLKK